MPDYVVILCVALFVTIILWPRAWWPYAQTREPLWVIHSPCQRRFDRNAHSACPYCWNNQRDGGWWA